MAGDVLRDVLTLPPPPLRGLARLPSLPASERGPARTCVQRPPRPAKRPEPARPQPLGGVNRLNAKSPRRKVFNKLAAQPREAPKGTVSAVLCALC